MTEKPTHEDLEGRILALEREVSDCRQVKETLLEEKYFNQTLLQAAPVFYVAINEKGQLIMINKIMLHALGYEQADVIGKDYMTTFVPKRDHDALSRVFTKLVTSNEPTLNENYILTREGQELLVEWHGRSIFNRQGEFSHFFGVGIDITQRKLLYEKLKRSEEKYRSILEALKEAVYICSPDLEIEYMNPAMIKRIGREAVGEPCYKTIYGSAGKCSWCVFDQIRDTNPLEYELDNPKDNRTFSIANFPIVHSDGSISKLTISRDITEAKTIKEQLYQTRKMEAVGRLAGGIAHDFNNILSGIFGFAGLARTHVQNPEKALKSIDQILTGARKAADLTQQILTFCRKTEPVKIAVRPFEPVKEALKLIRSTIPSGIEIREDIASTAAVLADPTQIYQIVMNLCTNAYHAMRETGGILSVSLLDTGALDQGSVPGIPVLQGCYIQLQVRDTGSGMEPQFLSKIFEPYFTTKKTGEGTGLGLAVVLGIVREHNGYVTVNSSPGKGTVFDVYFPVLEKQGDIRPEKIQETVIKGGTEKIMVVDDEDSIRSSTRGILEHYGYQVTTFSDAETALKAFEKDPDRFDLILTDMAMPLMSGYDFSGRVLKIRKTMPIFLCSGFSDTMSEAKAQALGILKYLQKPIESRTLLVLIRDVLDGNLETS